MRHSFERRCRRRLSVVKQLDLQLSRLLPQIGEVLAGDQRSGDVVQSHPVARAVRPLGGEHQLEAAVVIDLHVRVADVGQDGVASVAQAVQAEGEVKLLPAPAVDSVPQRRVQRRPVVQCVGVVHEKLPNRRHDLHEAWRVGVLFHLELRHGDEDAREEPVSLGAFRWVAPLGQCVHLFRRVCELPGQCRPCLRQFVVFHGVAPSKSCRTVSAFSPYSSSE